MKILKYTTLVCFGFLLALSSSQAETSEALSIKAKGKETVELRFNGRLQVQYDGLSLGGNQGPSNEPGTSHFYFRRLYFGAKAKLQNGIVAESVFNFAGNDVSIDKAIIGHKFSNGVTGTIGYQKVPFGFEETTSSSKLQTIERTAINRFFADDIDFSGRHTGLFVKGKLDDGFSYSFALVNGLQGEGSKLGGSSSKNNDLATFARLQWKKDALTTGIDYGSQSNNGIQNDAKTVTLGDVTAYTAYANYSLDGVNLLGEYFSGDLGAQGDVSGYALRASTRKGQYEPVIRYSVAEANSFNIDTDELIRRAPKVSSIAGTDNEIESLYVGLNYYYSKSVSFMFGYEQAEAINLEGDKSEVDGVRARIQVLW